MESANATIEDQWLSQADYARKFGISAAAVNKAIKAGRLRTNGKTGRYLLVDASSDLRGRSNALGLEFSGEVDENGFRAFEVPTAPPAEADMFTPQMSSITDLKSRKLEAEILVLRDRLIATRQKLFREVADGVLEAFTANFAELRSELLKLALPADKSNRLALTFDDCLQRFAAAVKALEAEQ